MPNEPDRPEEEKSVEAKNDTPISPKNDTPISPKNDTPDPGPAVFPNTRASINSVSRQSAFIAGLAKGLIQTEAARQAGYKDPSAAAKRLSHDPGIRDALVQIMEAKGLGLARVASELDRGLADSTADGKRVDWFDRLARLHKLSVDKPHEPTVQVNTQANGATVYQQIVSHFTTNGIVEDDGTTRPYKGREGV